jgi:hypothetical protein
MPSTTITAVARRRHAGWQRRPVLAVLRAAVVVLLLSVATVAAGCAAGQDFSDSGSLSQPPRYEILVLPLSDPEASSDGYELLLDFEIRAEGALPFRTIVQEIDQTTVYRHADGSSHPQHITLVEAFRLKSAGGGEHSRSYGLEVFQRDRHFESGFADSGPEVVGISVRRTVRAYAALVEGADFTPLGFAHLPANRDGTLKTEVPASFNRRYQEAHSTRGKVVADGRDTTCATYEISYDWVRQAGGATVSDLAVALPGANGLQRKLVSTNRPGAATAGGGGGRAG